MIIFGDCTVHHISITIHFFYLHILLGRLADPDPSRQPQVDWIYSGLVGGGGGVSGLDGGGAHLFSKCFHREPGWAEIHCTPASFYSTLSTTVQLTDLMWLASHQISSVRNGKECFNWRQYCCTVSWDLVSECRVLKLHSIWNFFNAIFLPLQPFTIIYSQPTMIILTRHLYNLPDHCNKMGIFPYQNLHCLRLPL
jgi:hypothetical protein